jgi:hypothetical protein
MNRHQLGIIYMLHFSQPYRHAKHYVGWRTSSTASTGTPQGTAPG